MDKAQNAKTATDNSNDEEMVRMATVEAMANKDTLGKVTGRNLETALQGKAIVEEPDGSGPWTVTTANATYRVDENGNVTKTGETGAVVLNGIILNPDNVSLAIGETAQINVTFEPENATDKTVTYTSNNISVATVDNTGLVTAVAAGNTTITVAGTNEKSTTFTVTVSDSITVSATATRSKQSIASTYNWTQLAEFAKIISDNSSTINYNTEKVTITKNGATYGVLVVGDTTTVTFDGTSKAVRILGFNHDTLVNATSAYGTGHIGTKAGISFEFIGDIGKCPMNSSNTNSGGWGACALKTGSSTSTIKGLDAYYLPKINISSSIKQVQKIYNATNSSTMPPTTTTNDKLWLLSGSEIFAPNASNRYGWANAKEGERYKYYALGNSTSGKTSGSNYWWLRSLSYSSSNAFCMVESDGDGMRSCCRYGVLYYTRFCYMTL